MNVAFLAAFGPLSLVAGTAYSATWSLLWRVYYREPTREEVLKELGW